MGMVVWRKEQEIWCGDEVVEVVQSPTDKEPAAGWQFGGGVIGGFCQSEVVCAGQAQRLDYGDWQAGCHPAALL